MMVTSDRDVVVGYLKSSLADKDQIRANNMVGLATYLHERHGEVMIVSEGEDSRVQVSYDGLQWTVRDIR